MNAIWKAFLDNSNQIDFDLGKFKLEEVNTIIPLSNYVVIKISGTDAQKFIQGQTTNDVTALLEGSWQLTCCCNQKGRVIAVIWLVKYQQDYLGIIESSTAPLLVSELKKFAVFSKVSIELDQTIFVFGAVGEILSQLAESALLQIIYTEKPKQGFLLYTAEHLTKLSHNLSIAPALFWQFLNINQNIPEVFKLTQEQFTPHQLNLPALNAVNFKKGCYRGQEIIARMHYLGKLKQELYKVKIHSNNPIFIGSVIMDASEKVLGQCVNVISLGQNQYLALAVLTKTELDDMIQLKEDALLEVLK